MSAQHLLEQPQAHRVPECLERLGRALPRVGEQVEGGRALLPLSLLATRKVDGADDQDGTGRLLCGVRAIGRRSAGARSGP
ncbi:MAG: hypothetical protein V9G15_01385 [Dermatophilaceae bacterium]